MKEKMITIKDCLNDVTCIDEMALVELSDKLWEIGDLKKIKESVSPELFTLHIGINMIGNWKGEGWWGVISEQAELVPFIPDTLGALGLPLIKTAFENIMSCFPDDTVYINDADYCDTVNFLQNARFKISNEKFNHISPERRKEMVKEVRNYLEKLEDLTEPLWDRYLGENDGWKTILDFIAFQNAGH